MERVPLRYNPPHKTYRGQYRPFTAVLLHTIMGHHGSGWPGPSHIQYLCRKQYKILQKQVFNRTRSRYLTLFVPSAYHLTNRLLVNVDSADYIRTNNGVYI